MSMNVLEERLKTYGATSQQEALHALKEAIQEIALCALARAGFFKKAAFQGGSCLRIVHKLNRFSEDLDFILLAPNTTFVWKPYLAALAAEFKLYNLDVTAIDRSKSDHAVKLAFLKNDSFGKVLFFTRKLDGVPKQTIQVKLEIDTNPPLKSTFQTNYLLFPHPFAILTQDLASLFASKCHALLCRPYVKGRDWFDFVWYVSKKIAPNYEHLTCALQQLGPWKDRGVVASPQWLLTALRDKIVAIDWSAAKQDTEHFLRVRDQEGLSAWGAHFFMAVLKEFEAVAFQ